MALPISAQQRSAQESPGQFRMRMYEMVSLLESMEVYYFYNIITTSMATPETFAYCLDFPILFLRQHSSKFNDEVTFLMSDNPRTWPIKLTKHYFEQSEPRVFAHGAGGWTTFLQDNRIKVGDFLIFTLVSFSQFEVIIGRAPGKVHPEDNENNAEEEDKVEHKSSALSSAGHAPACPSFLAAILHRGQSRLAVPRRFWDLRSWAPPSRQRTAVDRSTSR